MTCTMRLATYVFVCLGFQALLLGCGSKPAGSAVGTNPAAGTAGSLVTGNNRAISIITDKECATFAGELEKAILLHDGNDAGDLFDWHQMMDEALEGLSPRDKPNQYIEGMRSAGSKGGVKLLNTICAQLKEGGTYKFIRARLGSDGTRVLFRLLRADGGLNYHEIVLGRAGNKVVGTDVYVYSTGEKLSQTLRRMAVLGATSSDTSLIKRLRGTDSEFSRYSSECTAMMKAFQESRFADCLAAYGRLSPNLQKEKAFMLFRIFAAQKVNEQEYISAIDAFRLAYPKDACVDLVAIDSLTVKKQYGSAHLAIERLDDALGGDPYLHVMRAELYLIDNKPDDAGREANAAIAGDPMQTNALWVLVTIAVQKREFAKTTELLTRIQNEHGVKIGDLSALSTYAEFIKSPEYKKWLAEQPSTP